jgi:hypothetical protein
MTIFIFLSPQFLINHADAHEVIIECSHQEITLRVVAIDEAHIQFHHGTSFHSKIRALQEAIFQKIFRDEPQNKQPRLIALTDTMPINYLPLLSIFLTISLFCGDLLAHGTPDTFPQHEFEILFHICSSKGQYISKGLTLVSKFLQQHSAKSAVIICCNSHKQSHHFCDHLEQKSNKMELNLDAIHINWSFYKINEFLAYEFLL